MPKKYFIFLGLLILLTPLGLLAEGTAWGEWGQEELRKMLGFVPQGIATAEHWWKAFFPDYSIAGLGGKFFGSAASYLISAVIGSVIAYGLMVFIGKFLFSRQNH